MRFECRIMSNVCGVFALVTLSGCLKWFSADVATGVARLSVRNLGAVATIIANDETCGFKSPLVDDNPQIAGAVGTIGTGVWTVQNCELDLKDVEVSTDCQDNVTTASGKIVVNATRTIHGHITGHQDPPVIPEGPDSVTVDLQVSFKDFTVKKSNSGKWMRVQSGSASYQAQPRLAASAEKGVCAIATPVAKFSGVVWNGAKVFVHTEDREFSTDVPTSNFEAQNGNNQGVENVISGHLTVWDKNEQVPAESDRQGLDPDYDPEAFFESFACTEDLAQPVNFQCDLDTTLSAGAAKLSVRNVRGVLGLVNIDENCGFESPAVKAAAQTTGTVGEDGGLATYTIENCVIDYPVATILRTDCLGVDFTVKGRVVVKHAVKTVAGYLTGDPETPIVPTSQQPGFMEATAELQNFEVRMSDSDKILINKNGTISGSLVPLMAVDASNGACSLRTLHGDVRDIDMSGDVTVISGQNTFEMRVDSSNLRAVVGKMNGFENYIDGTIHVDGQEHHVPVNDDHTLDPAYSLATFDAAFLCEENMQWPVLPTECSFRSVLAQGAARLLVKSFGTVSKVGDSDTSCGFKSATGLLPQEVTGEPYTVGSMRWGVDDCVLGGTSPKKVDTDCVGKDLYINGYATYSATKTVDGELVLASPPIHPMDRQSVSVQLHTVNFNNFEVFELTPPENNPDKYMTIHAGSMFGTMYPVTGESLASPGAYFIATPVARFDGLVATNVTATLHSGAKRFNFVIKKATLFAFNGSYGNSANTLVGSITIDGETFSLPVEADETALNPDFEQASFDAAYACTEDLKETVPPGQ